MVWRQICRFWERPDEGGVSELEQGLGYEFREPLLLKQCLTHISYHAENTEESPGHNERLEFLGDAVLDLVLTEELMKALPELREGPLSQMRASMVNEATLAEKARALGLVGALQLGRGEIKSQNQDNPRLLASALEALIGGIYLDGGFEQARLVVQRLFCQDVDERKRAEHTAFFFAEDYKSRLQEILQRQARITPSYHVTAENGPPHLRHYEVEVRQGETALAQGEGRSKKLAEQDAARRALEIVDES